MMDRRTRREDRISLEDVRRLRQPMQPSSDVSAPAHPASSLGRHRLPRRSTERVRRRLGRRRRAPASNVSSSQSRPSPASNLLEQTEAVFHERGFPIKAVEPKVWVPFHHPPSGIPRRIVIERRRREFSEKRIEELLLQHGISFRRPSEDDEETEGEAVPDAGGFRVSSFENYLPLEAFDDTSFDCRTPQEWIELGEVTSEEGQTTMYFVPALTLVFEHPEDEEEPDTGWPVQTRKYAEWKSCRVLRLDEAENRYLVELEEEMDPATGRCVRLWQPRIFILFLAEDPEVFAERMAHCFRARRQAEARLKYNLYVDNMPNDEIPLLPPDRLDRMRSMALSTPSLHQFSPDLPVDDLMSEVVNSYKRTMNQIIFDKNLNDANQRAFFSFLHLPESDEEEEKRAMAKRWAYRAPTAEEEEARMMAKRSGVVQIPTYSFRQQFRSFQFNTFLSETCVIRTLLAVKRENLDRETMRVFNLPLKKVTQVEDFRNLQLQSIDRQVRLLEDEWKSHVVKIVTDELKGVQKGWLNIFEKRVQIYQMSKLKRFMNSIRCMMQDSLRFMMEASLVEFTNFVKDVNRYHVSIMSPTDVENVDKDQESAALGEPKKHIFSIELTHRDGEFVFSTPVEAYTEIILELFSAGIERFQNITNVEPHIMTNLYWNWHDIKKLACIRLHESGEGMSDPYPHVREWRDACLLEISEAVEPLMAYLSLYEEYEPLLQRDNQDFAKEFEAGEHRLEEFKREIQVHLKKQVEVLARIPVKIAVGTFLVDCSKVRNHLAKKCQVLADMILEILNRAGRQKVSYINSSFARHQRALNKGVTNIHQLTNVRRFMGELPQKVVVLQGNIQEMKAYYELLELFKYNISKEQFQQRALAMGWPKKIFEQREHVDQNLIRLEEEFKERMDSKKEDFKSKLDRIDADVAEFAKRTDFTRVKENAKAIRVIIAAIKECKREAEDFNQREVLFRAEVTDYSQVALIEDSVRPFANLWLTAFNWVTWQDSWMKDSPFDTLDAEMMDNEVRDAESKIGQCIREFRASPQILNIAMELQERIQAFKPNLPIVIALRNPGIRPRHWAQISREIGIDLIIGETIKSLSDVLDLDLQNHIEVIQRIADIAKKEYMIEKALRTMGEEWADTNFTIVSYGQTGTFVLKMTDEFQQQLDDHIALTQTISFSAFKDEFEAEIEEWDAKLNLVSEIVDEWLNCQREWMALEPIFTSPELIKQLPTLYKRFNQVNTKFRKLMGTVHHNPSVLAFCDSPKVLDTFRANNINLNHIQKGLSNYLQTKRKQFPRLYFLADDELLKILAKTKDPRAVQPYLKKCFSNMDKVVFEENGDISWMQSPGGEQVQLVDYVTPRGSVEIWLKEVEYQMRLSIKNEIRNALDDYDEDNRTEWLLRWPGQVIIVGSQIVWTRDTTQVLRQEGNRGLVSYHQKLARQINDVSDLLTGDVTPLERLKLSSLLTIEVHSRDVVDRMREAGCESVTDFEWISQLRYYWEERDIDPNDETSVYLGVSSARAVDIDEEEINFDCMVRQVEAQFCYGYEYLGNTTRLVITPLTDRIYLTLTGALKMVLGGSPAGPAGTGKTETVKDLAKAIAKQCVVFNCSDGLNEFAMAKFFKGLIMAGAWACFDEFNRIDIEVLSVIAQQITTLQEAIRAGLAEVEFEGTTVKVNPTFAVFITMNPGYAGRTELPDNLKALFRPVACMIPDYDLIAEIRLFSYGFKDAKSLSQKVVATFKLSSEQLSSQDHYDFGMRALNTVIAAAGLLKRNDPTAPEDVTLLRALIDSNVPKFLRNDVELFNGIINDLFPEVYECLPDPDYGELLSQLKDSAFALKFDPAESFLHKCLQLHSTIVLRHGLMIVGKTGVGKTANYRVLAHAFNELNRRLPEEFEKVFTTVINPKSVTMFQLYGNYDPNTREWQDGVLANEFKKFAEDDSTNRKWLVFDGPVDAIWIESMNTVLDDNRKLCLVSGAIVELSQNMNIIFEVEDLAVASPATVSRCGMVYMHHGNVSFQSRMQSWMMQLPERVPVLANYVERIEQLAEIGLLPAMEFAHDPEISSYITKMDVNFFTSFVSLFESLFKPYIVSEGEMLMKSDREKEELEEKLAGLNTILEPYFFFSIIWSVGATCDLEGRKKFDEFLRTLLEPMEIHGFPEDDLVYEYMFDDEMKAWRRWLETVPEFQVDPRKDFKDIIVPTSDTVRYRYLLEMLLKNDKNALCVGPTGTGKSLIVTETILNLGAKVIPVFVFFSARTSVNMTQDILDSRIERRRKGVYGPTAGMRNVVFVDDLNMPAKEKYLAQPPIELLRQWMDHRGWYEYKTEKLLFRKVIDTVFVAAMGPPGGGRHFITDRLVRHFNCIAFPELSDETVCSIFDQLVQSWMLSNLDQEMHHLSDQLVRSSVELYNEVRSTMLPTPSRSHYTFNLRDVAGVFQGILSANPIPLRSESELLKLWIHECRRVFKDRLVDDIDRNVFEGLLRDNLGRSFRTGWEEIVNPDVPLLYGDYCSGPEKHYEEVSDLALLHKTMTENLDYYNGQHRDNPMDLVMFMDAVEHISRVSRILRQKGGHALLLGVGGSGRRSLTKLAAFVAMLGDVMEVEMNKGFSKRDWRDFLRELMMKAGLGDNNEVVFLFSDSQIMDESFLEDINNILNSGDVPNIYEPQDFEIIYPKMKAVCAVEQLPMNPSSWFSRYVQQVKKNLHIVLALSPQGEVFRNRLRMFPSLVNCCTIDWFSAWPRVALISVAEGRLDGMNLDMPNDVYEMCAYIHRSVERQSSLYFEQTGRHNYVTPTSFLELLTTFRTLHKERSDKISSDRRKFEVGLDTLRETEDEVARLETELAEKKPQLLDMQHQIDVNMEKIQRQTEAARIKRDEIQGKESDAEEKERMCRGIASETKARLDEAVPALEEALQDLRNLQVKDVREVARYNIYTKGVKKTIKAVCVMLDIAPVRKMVDGSPKRDYLTPGKDFLKSGARAISRMVDFDRDRISAKKIAQIKPFIDDPIFTPENIAAASTAATAMCQFVRCMYRYYHVSREVEPLRRDYAAATEEHQEVVERLNLAREELAEVEGMLMNLKQQNATMMKQRKSLADEVDLCNVKMTRATKLIQGLAEEKDRWVELLELFVEQERNIIGDMLVAAGSISYLGSFTYQFREKLRLEWLRVMNDKGIAVEEETDVTKLVEPVTIREWTKDDLPFDTLSIQNAVIMSKSKRWPLFIDPQLQANRWVKKKEKLNNLKVTDFNQKDYMRTLINAIQFGNPVLLENVGEDLPAEIEPILLQQVTLRGGARYIMIGEDAIPFSDDFRLYLTTKLRNPHYSPEISSKVALLNFYITPDGLEDQLLGTVVAIERQELEKLKGELMIKNVKLTNQLAETQNKILQLLEENKDDVLGSEALVDTLGRSRKKSLEVKEKLAEAARTRQEIDQTRNLYKPVARRGAILFFAIADLANVDPMYQYSLRWYIDLYKYSIEKAEESEDLDTRLECLTDHFTHLLYSSVCQSMFSRHKLLFSFVMTARIMFGDGKIDGDEWHYFLTGSCKEKLSRPQPPDDWITELTWNEVQSLSGLPYFGEPLMESFLDPSGRARWKDFFDEANLVDVEVPFFEDISNFQRLLILRALRPDMVTKMMFEFVQREMDPKYVTPPRFDLLRSFKNANSVTPIVFILSPGADPKHEMDKFARAMRIRRFESISLGRGTERKATNAIEDAMQTGSWVLLQNCHLATSFMEPLSVIVDSFDPQANHHDFRLWLTSMPTNNFPVSILQNSVKLTLEPPKGLRANLMRSYDDLSDELLHHPVKPVAFKKLLLSLCFFHAVVQERRTYGALGWNRNYEFTVGDLQICLRQLRMFLQNYEEIPYQIINFLTSAINYGGRVTDHWDRRTIETLAGRFIREDIMEDGYRYTSLDEYYSVEDTDLEGYMGYLEQLPNVTPPDVVGLHGNASITCSTEEMNLMTRTIIAMNPKGSTSGVSELQHLSAIAADVLSKVPKPFDIDMIRDKFPTTYKESMNTVLVQEVLKYNRLLAVIDSSLTMLIDAIKGVVVMSESLDKLSTSIFTNQVPEVWAEVAYPSEMPFNDWVLNLLTRCRFIQNWIEDGTPKAFWISGFFFPQGFLTGILQNYARAHQVAIDRVSFGFKVLENVASIDDLDDLEDGCYIYGLFLEGARWDVASGLLRESRPKILFDRVPVIQLIPSENRVQPSEGIYNCPLYKTLRRAGTLSTTGHSTNFVVTIELESDLEESHWVERGVALICSLRYHTETQF